MELTTKSASLILLASGVVRCACTRIPQTCSLGFVCILACSSVFQHSGILAFLGKFSEHLFSLVFHNCKDSVYNSFLSPFPLSTDLLSVTGACFLLLYNMRWGLMAGLPGFSSHGRDPLQGASCPQWKLLDISGTQLLLRNELLTINETNGGSSCQWCPYILMSQLTVGGMSCCLL